VPYLNLDDEFPEHPKIDPLSDGAFRLDVAGMAYCARLLTDGYVPKDRVHRLMPVYKPTYLRELLDGNVWHEADGGYRIHDYLDWNRSREWWTKRREGEAKRQAEWRARAAARKAAQEAENAPDATEDATPPVTPLRPPRTKRPT
jgi:hypothetical protein